MPRPRRPCRLRSESCAPPPRRPPARANVHLRPLCSGQQGRSVHPGDRGAGRLLLGAKQPSEPHDRAVGGAQGGAPGAGLVGGGARPGAVKQPAQPTADLARTPRDVRDRLSREQRGSGRVLVQPRQRGNVPLHAGADGFQGARALGEGVPARQRGGHALHAAHDPRRNVCHDLCRGQPRCIVPDASQPPRCEWLTGAARHRCWCRRTRWTRTACIRTRGCSATLSAPSACGAAAQPPRSSCAAILLWTMYKQTFWQCVPPTRPPSRPAAALVAQCDPTSLAARTRRGERGEARARRAALRRDGVDHRLELRTPRGGVR